MAQQPYQPQRGGQGGRGSGGGFGGHPPEPKSLPAPRPVIYFQPDGSLVPALMDDQAEDLAQNLSQVTTTQLRRFYDDVLTLRQRLAAEQRRGRDKEAAFNDLRADFKMLKAKAVYAHGRSEKTMPRPLLQFFIDHVAAANNAREFEAFCKHFQAVVAFHKFYGENK
ncbi:MAG: type III-A CRISPR-associated protein Csm2 [Candidatus Competibacteraceae bacterium]|nr:MAG: type III-A CRISPR-associated protein Csm2 [Candidatus Competibacteraceae bacterium]